MLIQYREELYALQQEEMSKATSPTRDPRDRRYSNTRKLGKEAFAEEEKEQVMIDLLIILQKIPIQVIGVAPPHSYFPSVKWRLGGQEAYEQRSTLSH